MRLVTFDMTRKFMRFYEQASEPELTMDERWDLWREIVRFAAVPPTPEGMEMARTMFDQAWPRYGDMHDVIKEGGRSIRRSARPMMRAVTRLLQCRRWTRPALLIIFVGFLENNAFVAGMRGWQFVAIPAELPEQDRELTMAHEFTHVVHHWKARLSGGWERSIAQTILSEGLAMHASAALVPGRAVHEYVEHASGWWATCQARRDEIIAGIRPHLTASDSDTVWRFTIGEGASGLQREAYAVGWWVVDHWLKSGIRLADVASWREDTHVVKVNQAIEELLAR